MAGFNGFGGGNQMQQLMKQAQKMQEQMTKAQEELESAEIQAESGNGLVKIVVNGKKDIKSITLDKEVVDPEDIEMLEDLLMAAINSAYEKAEKMSNEKLGPLGGKMGGLI